MQEVQIIRYCDGHLVLDDVKETEGAVTKTYNLGDGPRIIEICEWCNENLSIKDLRNVLSEAGRPPQEEATPERGSTIRVKSHAGNHYKRKVGTRACKFCDAIPFTSTHGCSTHEFRAHPYQRLLWERETEFVKEARLSKSQQERRLKRLEIAEEMGLTLEEAAEKEKAAWNAGWRPSWNASAESAVEPLNYTG